MAATNPIYTFDPGMGELTLYAFNLAGIRNTSITQEYLTTARMAANMMLGTWSANGVNLWQVDLWTTHLVKGTATYNVPKNTITILDAYITIGTGNNAMNRVILPVSRTEFASYPKPQERGTPSVFWFDRLLDPTVTLWQVPDGQQVSVSFYRVVQAQDAELMNNQTPGIPYYFNEAFAYGLAFRLASIWNPAIAPGLKGLADEAYGIASRQNEETENIYVTPMLSSYYRV